MIHRAKVLKAPDASTALPLARVHSPSHRARVVRRALVDAEQRAEELLLRVQNEALAVRQAAESGAAALRKAAADEGRAQGYAEVLARFAALARLEATTDERGLARSIEIARVLAERLIGASIAADESTIVALAAQVLSEVRGARRIELHVHPTDLAVLETHLGKPSALEGLKLVANAACERGNFRVVTDVGTMDAEVGERLDLLAAKLAETLRKGA